MSNWLELDYKSPSAEELLCIKFFDRFIIDQQRAKEKLSSKLAAWRHGLSDKDKPASILLLPGPSGVGKTYLVRVFAKLLIGDMNAFTRIDCSNLQESHTISRLLGSPPGYVGYNEEADISQERLDHHYKERHPQVQTEEEKRKIEEYNNKLFVLMQEIEDLKNDIKDENDKNKRTQISIQIRKKQKEFLELHKEQEAFIKKTERKNNKCPSVLLFDEIEKIHPAITRALLPIFDTGKTKLANGKTVDFKNCFIFMTSNIGARKLADMQRGKGRIGFGTKTNAEEKEEDKNIYQTVIEEIMHSDHFPTELVGRIGKENIVVFHSLKESGIRSIIDLQIKEMEKRIQIASPETKLIFSQALKDFLFSETQDPVNKALGARPIESVIKAKILDPLMNLVIKNKDGGITPGDKIRIDVRQFTKDGEIKNKVVIEKVKDQNKIDII